MFSARSGLVKTLPGTARQAVTGQQRHCLSGKLWVLENQFLLSLPLPRAWLVLPPPPSSLLPPPPHLHQHLPHLYHLQLHLRQHQDHISGIDWRDCSLMSVSWALGVTQRSLQLLISPPNTRLGERPSPQCSHPTACLPASPRPTGWGVPRHWGQVGGLHWGDCKAPTTWQVPTEGPAVPK